MLRTTALETAGRLIQMAGSRTLRVTLSLKFDVPKGQGQDAYGVICPETDCLGFLLILTLFFLLWHRALKPTGPTTLLLVQDSPNGQRTHSTQERASFRLAHGRLSLS